MNNWNLGKSSLDSIWGSVRRAPVDGSARDSVWDYVGDSVWDSVRDSVWDSVWGDINNG